MKMNTKHSAQMINGAPFISSLLVLLLMVVCPVLEVSGQESKALDKAGLKKAIDRGANWLIDNQRSDGSWGSMAGDPGITGMVIKALADTPRAYREKDGPLSPLLCSPCLINSKKTEVFTSRVRA